MEEVVDEGVLDRQMGYVSIPLYPLRHNKPITLNPIEI
ncbi:unnamed protein product [Enterobius vermicularis]|uniref:Transposase n=1 Tax=Enterobius vermicularis TaxID=51028 RepID=A0A0N4V1C5_ENTVE|nr:unnamed protein product [Enterobius vermicularis]